MKNRVNIALLYMTEIRLVSSRHYWFPTILFSYCSGKLQWKKADRPLQTVRDIFKLVTL